MVRSAFRKACREAGVDTERTTLFFYRRHIITPAAGPDNYRIIGPAATIGRHSLWQIAICGIGRWIIKIITERNCSCPVRRLRRGSRRHLLRFWKHALVSIVCPISDRLSDKTLSLLMLKRKYVCRYVDWQQHGIDCTNSKPPCLTTRDRGMVYL